MGPQVQLSVVTEDQQRDERCQGTVESSRVRVEDFGGYCEELHASNDRGFREQFYVSEENNNIIIITCCCGCCSCCFCSLFLFFVVVRYFMHRGETLFVDFLFLFLFFVPSEAAQW